MIREAFFLQQLSKIPHIVNCYDHFLEASEVFTIIELMNGNTLSSEVKISDLPFLLYNISNALRHIHKKGIAHMDIHPSNF
jgi:serine/threonine protein kinase